MRKKIHGVYIKQGDDPVTVEDNTSRVLEQLKNSVMNLDPKRRNVLLYWLNNWGSYYLPNEKDFDPLTILDYKRGDIIEVDFGFKIGSEQGGLHYAVVMDNSNKKSSPILTVVPLKSFDDGDTIDESIEILIDSNIFDLERIKCNQKLAIINKALSEGHTDSEQVELERQKKFIQKDLRNFSKKTIAQPSQICAASKIRIDFPIKNSDKLYQLKMPEEYMKKIDDMIKKLFL